MRRAGLSRALRLALVAVLVAWFFSPPAVRDAVPLWLAFAVALALEVHFVVTNWGRQEPFFGPPDRRPAPRDRARYGDGRERERVVPEGGGEWVDLFESDEDDAEPPAMPPSPRRRRLLAESAVALAVVVVVAMLGWLIHDAGWEGLDATARTAGEARFSREASLLVGRPVTVRCDTSGRRVGRVQHADGVAVVGGRQAWLEPRLCLALYRLAFDGDVPSFSETARAIAVLAHESWHLRGSRDEGTTECYALQSGVGIGRRLGLGEDTARRMMRSMLVQNELYRRTDGRYVVPEGCVNRGSLDLDPAGDRFP
jgi:hypothetical protein